MLTTFSPQFGATAVVSRKRLSERAQRQAEKAFNSEVNAEIIRELPDNLTIRYSHSRGTGTHGVVVQEGDETILRIEKTDHSQKLGDFIDDALDRLPALLGVGGFDIDPNDSIATIGETVDPFAVSIERRGKEIPEAVEITRTTGRFPTERPVHVGSVTFSEKAGDGTTPPHSYREPVNKPVPPVVESELISGSYSTEALQEKDKARIIDRLGPLNTKFASTAILQHQVGLDGRLDLLLIPMDRMKTNKKLGHPIVIGTRQEGETVKQFLDRVIKISDIAYAKALPGYLNS